MASGSYAQKRGQQFRSEDNVTKPTTLRATRHLSAVQERVQEDYDDTPETMPFAAPIRSLANPDRPRVVQKKLPSPQTELVTIAPSWLSATLVRYQDRVTDGYWLKSGVICLICAICFLSLLLSVGIFQRPASSYISNGGRAYDNQVGGDKADTWEHPPQTTILPQTGPYAVLHDPTITVDFINQVLNNYKSPAAGKGQALYDFGVQYGIDPAFALAFFMHESTFGNQGEAKTSLSLGNLRCIPNFRCTHNFAQFDNWEDGFKAWYQLIRNLYVAQWKLTTVDQIIPRYAPQADNNNEQGYIAALKHAIDTWHAGQIIVR